MPFPLVVLALLGLATYGAKQAASAHSDNTAAQRLIDEARAAYDAKRQQVAAARDATHAAFDALARLKLSVWKDDIGSFVGVFERLRHVEVEGAEDVPGLGQIGFTPMQLAEIKTGSLQAGELLAGGGIALSGGAIASIAAYGGVSMLASASTGTAIVTLSGAAASNATLAWLGGGTLAAGGFGIAGGTLVLGGILVAPALALGGHLLAARAHANLQTARAEYAKAMQALAEMDVIVSFLDAARETAQRMHLAIARVAERARSEFDALDRLTRRSVDYSSYSRDERDMVHRSVLFAQTLKLLMETRILTTENNLSQDPIAVLGAADRFLANGGRA